MLKNYFKIALRNLLRHKGYAAINISGLAIGIACCIVIFLFVSNELSYDRFHQNGDRIFRVLRHAVGDGTFRKIAVTSPPFAPALITDFPSEVEESIRVMTNDGLVTYGEKAFQEKKFYFADKNFFEFFSYPLLAGQPLEVLSQPNDVVISKEMAEKYFGDEDPIGKIISLDKRYEFRVTGIFDDPPANTHLTFDFVASLAVFESRSWFTQWWNNNLFTYVLLRPGVEQTPLESQMPQFMDKYFGEHFRKTGLTMSLVLEPLPDIYLNHATSFDFIPHGDPQTIVLFTAIAILILIIACINYTNLATAKSSGRAKEVGMRKVMGAQRQNLIGQFVGESVMLSLLATALAVALVEVGLHYFNQWFQLSLSFDHNVRSWSTLFDGAVAVGVLGGGYPALFLSAFQPAKALKSKLRGGSHKSFFRQALVVVQFTVSIVLIICTLVIARQMDFVRTKKLGFEKEQMVLVDINNRDFYQNRERFKEELLRHTDVINVSLMSGEPGGFHDNFGFDIVSKPGHSWRMRTVFTDYDYCKTFGLKIVAGRDFSREFGADSEGILLNEAAVKNLGWDNEEALGQEMVITLRDSVSRHVVGVVADFHFTSLKNEIEPLAISIADDNRVVAAKIRADNIQHTLDAMTDAYSNAAPGFPFAYRFLDESFDSLYRAEQKQQQIFTIFAGLAIFVACLGLYALAAFSAEQRTKEIGIRKVLGSTVVGIVSLLSKDFVKLVALSSVIAIPLGYFAMERWLQEFAYRTSMGGDVFVLSCFAGLLISLATVIHQALKAALANPVDSLKYE
jgi:putative ABC transport system permease protein